MTVNAFYRSCLAVAFVSVTLAACGSGPSKGDCEKLRDHLIDLEAAAAGGGAVEADQRAELEDQKKAIRKVVGLDYCLEDMTADQVKCGLKARSLEELDQVCNKS